MKKLTSLVLIAVVITLSICEIGLRGLQTNAAPVQTPYVIPYSYHYAHSPYWSDAFAHSFHQVFSKGVPNPDNQISLGTVSAPGYTIVNNERLTTDQPTTYTRTVWLFGSSSVWGAYVDNSHTIASYLQTIVNAHNLPWRVVNMAQPGINATLEVYWLKQSKVKSGDIVLFIDGGVDLYYTFDDAFKQWKSDSLACRMLDITKLMLASMWCNQYKLADTPESYINKAIAVDFARYWRDIDKAQSRSNAIGARFIHFMQPTTYNQWLMQYILMARGDTFLTIDRTYFIDDLHYDDNGHSSIANQIFQNIAPSF